MHKKKGDTLIEVALAIGIFSMIAITIVSVTSSSTTGAQSSLELTITREELDAQAEALRFIHDSYVNGSQSADTTANPYHTLWNKITELAVREDLSNDITFNPTTCEEIYQGDGTIKTTAVTNPFIINTRQLSSPSNYSAIILRASSINATRAFYAPTTYPRIIYGTRTVGSNITDESLYAQVDNGVATIQRVEGIFIVAVKDAGSSVVSGSGSVSNKQTYYDFYIRSCWMPPGATRASTVSTTVRLYDPAAITY